MMLIEETYLPETALPVEALKRHLRMGTGFAEDDVQDEVLAAFLRAAIAAIEARAGKALIARDFVLTAEEWADGITLPIAPVVAVTGITRIDAFGVTEALVAQDYALKPDLHAPRIEPRRTGAGRRSRRAGCRRARRGRGTQGPRSS